MGQARKKYTREYRDEAVDLVVKSGRPIAEIARDLGINEATLGNWVHRAKQAGELPVKPDLTRANRLVTCFEPLEDVAGGAGEFGVEGEALAVDLDGR